ncbi:iron-containing alcohol dehydrogenase [bacterium 1XD21-13]|nr:iron-containing alcohol dehydrogenase [bacterium 1XD21-13]
MQSFVYEIPVRVYFGENQLDYVGAEVKRFGSRVGVLTYDDEVMKTTKAYVSALASVRESGLEIIELPGVEPNPRIETVRKGAAICKEKQIEVILAIGGGSAIDAGKWIAAGAKVEFDPWEFYSEGREVEETLPLISVMTAAATGSDMNACAMLTNPETQDKIGLFSNLLLPKTSFLDPTVTYSVSKRQTACGSADIMSHVMEGYFDMNPGLYMLDCFMEGLLKTVVKYAPVALNEPDNYEARANLLWAASWASNDFGPGGRVNDWCCHRIERMSDLFNMTHGVGIAIVTPRWLEYCLDETTLPKYVQFGVQVFGIDTSLAPMEIAKKAIEKLSEFFFDTLGLPSTLGELGIEEKEFRTMAQHACAGQTLNGLKPLTEEDVMKIYEMCK